MFDLKITIQSIKPDMHRHTYPLSLYVRSFDYVRSAPKLNKALSKLPNCQSRKGILHYLLRTTRESSATESRVKAVDLKSEGRGFKTPILNTS